jgi:hypothetical protein
MKEWRKRVMGVDISEEEWHMWGKDNSEPDNAKSTKFFVQTI